ncbi:MAG: molecular chaperone HtpG [Sorangiineae bacterium NIC37A_2]|mgnify:CR=1 FL=1|nr:MAG: molecular chaperone HtpG [Sorangiineae bacterium NIC37A_2]
MAEKKSLEFQADVSKVLHLVVHSLYTKKEIFLRELISNAADAIDKRRFRALTDPTFALEAGRIVLTPNEKEGTLTISDNGIGMTEEELTSHLGTIARSGTREFTENLKKAGENSGDLTQLIGQFGVGFYSAFLVAEQVEVTSRAVGHDQAYRWTSDARTSFTIEPAERDEPGTTIVLKLKEDEKEYAKPWRVREVVRHHSDYIGHPVELIDPEKPDEPEILNQAKALWQRNPKEVTKEQYEEFYKHLAHDWEAPLAYRHFKIEGNQEFAGIVYLPKNARADLLDPRTKHGVRLHVRRVLAMESSEELLPSWLRFVRGVVDSEDLPLNVSRETLQDSRIVRIMRKQVVSNVLTMIEELKKERPEEYVTFWTKFGAILKEGLYFEPELKERLSELCLFAHTLPSTESSDAEKARENAEPFGEWTTLAGYVSRMKEGQKGIYYIEGTSLALLRQSPHLEKLVKSGHEVLLLTDNVDSFALEKLTDYADKPFINVTSADLDLGESDAEKPEPTDALTEKLQTVLGSKVQSVRNSSRLAESPACLVTPEGGLPPHMVAMFKAQNLTVPETKRILEINPDHPIIQNLRKMQLLNSDSPELARYMELLYDQALLAEGAELESPAQVARRIGSLLEDLSSRAIRD